MYQHRTIHTAISNAISHRPTLILVDVTVDPEWAIRGEACIVFQTRGDAYKRPYTLEEIRGRLAIHGDHEGYVAEGCAYRHLHFCDETVPVDIRAALCGDPRTAE